MITKYKLFKEGLLSKMTPKTDEEFLKSLKELEDPKEIMKFACEENFKEGIDLAIERGYSFEKDGHNYIWLSNKKFRDELILQYKIETPEYEWFVNYMKDTEKYENVEFPNVIFWRESDEVLFEQDLNTNEIIVNYDKIWSVLENRFKFEYEELIEFIVKFFDYYPIITNLTEDTAVYPSVIVDKEHPVWFPSNKENK